MLSVEDFPANPSAWLDDALPSEIPDGSGLPSHIAFAIYDPTTLSWKTSQGSLWEEWATYSESWPLSGMTLSGRAYRQAPSVPRTFAGECSSWPTPTARLGRGGGTPSHALALRRLDRRYGPNLDDVVSAQLPDGKRGRLNPTWIEWLMGFPPGWSDLAA